MRPSAPGIGALLLRSFLPAVAVFAMALAALAYNWLYATILDGFDRKLVTASALTGALVDADDHAALVAAARAGAPAPVVEAGTAYRRNVAPMRRVRETLGLTYLYTQLRGGPQDVVYILDATTGPDHSALGSPDDLPAETVAGLREVQRDGRVYVSPIEYQDHWGLLKTAAAPLRDARGAVAATAGADVNISVIQVATQQALFESAMVGLGSLLACLLVALIAVRRVAGPIAALKDEALRIAAGDLRPPAAGPAPREVAGLRAALETVSARLASTAQEEATVDAALASQSDARALDGAAVPAALVLADDGRQRVLWVSHGADTPGAVLARRAMLALAGRIAASPALAAQWRALADLEHGCCLIADRAAGTLAMVGQGDVRLRDGPQESRWRGGAAVPLGPQAALVTPGGSLPLFARGAP